MTYYYDLSVDIKNQNGMRYGTYHIDGKRGTV